jgi:hypothetical protein
MQVNSHEAFIFSNRWSSFRTVSGTVTDGELRLNQSGLWQISEENGDNSESFLDPQGLLPSFVDSCSYAPVECT